MESYYGIEMDQLFKFNSSHFVVYKGFRECLHGHNYKVSIKIKAKKLNSSYYVIDFDIVKEIMNEICEELKHCLLLPGLNKFLKFEYEENYVHLTCEDGSKYLFPKQDVNILDIDQISAECLSKYILDQFIIRFKSKYPINYEEIQIKKITVKVYEDIGKSGLYSLSLL
jgi:6-pyruvoyl-tetrahydropterin synthase